MVTPLSTETVSIRARKRPIEVDAWQFDGACELERAPDWVRNYAGEALGAGNIKRRYRITRELSWDGDFWYLRIPTLEGWHTASKGDWIIKGVKGELYPCKPEIFEETYERV